MEKYWCLLHYVILRDSFILSCIAGVHFSVSYTVPVWDHCQSMFILSNTVDPLNDSSLSPLLTMLLYMFPCMCLDTMFKNF